MAKLNILIIEDDLLSRITLEQKLKLNGDVYTAASKEEVKAKILLRDYGIAFLDLDLDRELEGLNIISSLKQKNIYTVVLSGREEESIIQKAYELGCDDYLVKPFNTKGIELVLRKFNQKNVKQNLFNSLKEKFQTEDQDFLIQIETITSALLSDRPILITGETGTGKTYLAKLIHELSGEHTPFININCSEFSESLLESELFGHEKGSFTGAIKNKKGVLELANNGILFLDEIGTMSAPIQRKILKAIEEKSFYPVGSETPVKSNFRLISATCDDLSLKVLSGEFRQDLYHRIIGFNIKLKPIRERKNDISKIIKNFIRKGERQIVISSEALEYLEKYSWPGNIREIEKVIEVLRSSSHGIISKSDLELILSLDFTKESNYNFDFNRIKEIGLNQFIEELEMKIVEETLKQNNEKVRKTLSDLKISNNSYYRIVENIKIKGQKNV